MATGIKTYQRGNLYITASSKQTSLNHIFNLYQALNGTAGKSKNLHGANAPDIEFVVPIGTTIRQVFPSELLNKKPEESEEILEIDQKEEEIKRIEISYKFKSGYFPQEDRIKWYVFFIIGF